MGIVNFGYSALNGFKLNTISIALDIFTLFAFGFNVGWPWAAGLVIAELFLPLYLASSGLFAPILFILTRGPWWLIFLSLDELKTDPKSTFSKVLVGAVCIVFLIVASPSILRAQTISNSAASNQEAFTEIKDAIGSSVSKGFSATGKLVKLGSCYVTSVTDVEGCKAKIITPEEELAAVIFSELKTTPQGLDLSVSDFLPDNRLREDTLALKFTATNNLDAPAKLNFACGLGNIGKATTTPQELTIEKGRLSEQDGTVVCSGLDVSRARKTEFYFNVTASDVTSTGSRDIIVLDEGVKKAIIDTSTGTTDNDRILNSQYGPFVKLNQDDLNSQVGENDLIRPIVKISSVNALNTKSPLIYGIKQGTRLPFGLFIVNNGRGRIEEIKDVKFTVDESLFELSPSNCGITPDLLKRTRWTSYEKDSYFSRICDIIVKKNLQNPNNALALQIVVNVKYDYLISRHKTVDITGQVST